MERIGLRKQLTLLIRTMHAAQEDRWACLTRQIPLSTAQHHILYVLASHRHPLTLTEISRTGCWHLSTVSRIIKPLVEGNYVVVKTGETNRKSKHVSLTEKGRALLRELAEAFANETDFPFDLSFLDKEELSRFIEIGLGMVKRRVGRDLSQWLLESRRIIDP